MPGRRARATQLDAAGLGGATTLLEDGEAFRARVAADAPYNVLAPAAALGAFPLAGQFVSTLLCIGHIKSASADDAAFLAAFEGSPKWLAMRPGN